MWNINSITINGRLTRDVELKQISNGSAVANFDIAVGGRPAKGGDSPTYFFHVVAWGKTAENCAQFLSKGKPCSIMGSLVYEDWVNAAGEKRNKVSISADRVEYLGGTNKTPANAPMKAEDFYGEPSPVDREDNLPGIEGEVNF
jgi:single-strand DNA-binding protein